MPEHAPEEDSGAVPTQNTHGLQMAPQRMLELAQKAAELIVARIVHLPGNDAWDGDFRDALDDALMEAPPESGRPAEEVLERAANDSLRLAARLDHPRSFAFVSSAPTWPGYWPDFMAGIQHQRLHLAGC